MTGLLGNHYHFTEHTYDWLGMPPMSFNSFEDFTKKVGDARVFGGIHTRLACDNGCKAGNKVAQNIQSHLKFKS